MSAPDNPFEQDWEAFRFPVRPVRIFSDGEAVAAQEDGDGEGDGEGEGSSGAAGSLEMGWQYVHELAEIHHLGRRKRIRLADLDTGLKIIRLLAAIEARPELDVDDLIDALEYASWDCHGQSLGNTLEAHATGATIAWSPLPDPSLSAPSQPVQRP